MSMRKWFGERTVEHLPAMRRYARMLVGEQQADDLVHEALVRAMDAQGRFRPDGNMRGWLLTILYNRFVSDWRQNRAENVGIAHLALHGADHAPPQQEDGLHLSDLKDSLALLSAEHRAVLHLIVAEGLTYEAAAAILGVPVGTVMSRLSRARGVLRQMMSGKAQPLRAVESQKFRGQK